MFNYTENGDAAPGPHGHLSLSLPWTTNFRRRPPGRRRARLEWETLKGLHGRKEQHLLDAGHVCQQHRDPVYAQTPAAQRRGGGTMSEVEGDPKERTRTIGSKPRISFVLSFSRSHTCSLSLSFSHSLILSRSLSRSFSLSLVRSRTLSLARTRACSLCVWGAKVKGGKGGLEGGGAGAADHPAVGGRPCSSARQKSSSGTCHMAANAQRHIYVNLGVDTSTCS